MAWRFRQRHVQTSDVLDPFHWNLNHMEFASEVNGFLDRDNFRESIFDADHIISNSCNVIESDDSGVFQDLDPATTAWQGSTSIARKAFRTDTDALAIVEYSGWHVWADSEDFNDLTCCRYQLSVDGIILYRSGWQSIHREKDSIYLVGATPLPPGAHVAMVEIQIGLISTVGDEPDRLDPTDATGFESADREILIHLRMR